jgi:hypothetical protein
MDIIAQIFLESVSDPVRSIEAYLAIVAFAAVLLIENWEASYNGVEYEGETMWRMAEFFTLSDMSRDRRRRELGEDWADVCDLAEAADRLLSRDQALIAKRFVGRALVDTSDNHPLKPSSGNVTRRDLQNNVSSEFDVTFPFD